MEESVGFTFSISDSQSCRHIKNIHANLKLPVNKLFNLECEICHSSEDNYICLTCGVALCSRKVNQHMVLHFTQNNSHYLALSCKNFLPYCYQCSSYVYVHNLGRIFSSAQSKEITDKKSKVISTLDEIQKQLAQYDLNLTMAPFEEVQNYLFLLQKSTVKASEEIKVKKLKETSENNICAICYIRPRNIVFLNCKHLNTCEECSQNINECITCREKNCTKNENLF